MAGFQLTLHGRIWVTPEDFVQSCRQTNNDVFIIHQDSFAADYQEDEYRLLGMAIKVA
jgi:hypothetical protein